MKTDKEFLTWIFERLVNVHGENKNYDYMLRLKRIIDGLKTEKQDNQKEG